MDVGSFRRRDDFLICGVRTSHSDIIPDCSCLKPCILKHHAISGPQALPRHFPDIGTFYTDRTILHIVEPHKQIDDRRLAASGGTYDGNPLSGFHIKIKITDQLLSFHIGEVHMLRPDISLYIFQLHRVLRFRRLRFFLDQIKDSLRAYHGILKLGNYA